MFFRTESIFTGFVRRTDVFGNLWMFRCVMILKVILMLAKYHAITGHNLFLRTSIYLGINIFPFTSVKIPIPLKDKHPQIITLTLRREGRHTKSGRLSSSPFLQT